MLTNTNTSMMKWEHLPVSISHPHHTYSVSSLSSVAPSSRTKSIIEAGVGNEFITAIRFLIMILTTRISVRYFAIFLAFSFLVFALAMSLV